MSCLSLPALPELTLPPGLSIPSVGETIDFGGADFCCKIKVPVPPIPLVLPPGSIPLPVAMALKALMDSLRAAMAQIPPVNCPRE